MQLLSYQTESHGVEAYSFNARELPAKESHCTCRVPATVSSAWWMRCAGAFGLPLAIEDYHEHTLGHQSDSRAVAYIRCTLPQQEATYGVGIDVDSASAAAGAVFNVARALSVVGAVRLK